MGLNDSKEHGLGQGVKTGASAADVAARTASTFWTKNLEKTSAVAESGILHLESLHISLFIVRQHFLLSPAAASILASQKPRSLEVNKACIARMASTHLLLSDMRDVRWYRRSRRRTCRLALIQSESYHGVSGSTLLVTLQIGKCLSRRPRKVTS